MQQVLEMRTGLSTVYIFNGEVLWYTGYWLLLRSIVGV